MRPAARGQGAGYLWVLWYHADLRLRGGVMDELEALQSIADSLNGLEAIVGSAYIFAIIVFIVWLFGGFKDRGR